MPRLFLGNFDFEYHLADPHFRPGKKLLEINLRFASAWFAIAEQGDFIWLPDVDAPLPKQLTELADRVGVQLVREDHLPTGPDIEFIPWGWLPWMVERAGDNEWHFRCGELSRIQVFNSRYVLEDEGEFVTQVESAEQFEALLNEQQLSDGETFKWIVKPDYSMSGRDCLKGTGASLTDGEKNWINHRLRRGRLFFEPWLNKINEASLHFDFHDDRKPDFVGLAELITDKRGQYVASRVGNDDWQDVHATEWSDLMEACDSWVDKYSSIYWLYVGMMGIDAMRYRDSSGQTRIRPIQDINARWTMGRLAVEYAKRFPPVEPLLWTPLNPLPHLGE